MSILEPVAGAATITPDELRARLDDPTLTVVDVRAIAAVQRLAARQRGARRPRPGREGAPGRVAGLGRRAEIARLLAEKGAPGGREIVVYGDGDAEAGARGTHLAGAGHRGRPTLEGGFAAWAQDERNPVERLRHYERLVHVGWLRALLGGRVRRGRPAGHALLFHVNFGVPEEYADGHIPGAHYLDTNWLESPAGWNRRSPAELDQRSARWASRQTRR